MNLDLGSIDLISISSDRGSDALKALYVSSRRINFRSIKLFSSSKPVDIPGFDYEFIKIDPVTLEGYNRFQLTQVPKYSNADFVMSVEPDGFVINPDKWDDKFLNFDYIGAPFSRSIKGFRVGNGGFSLRSKKLLREISSAFNSTDVAGYRRFLPDFRGGALMFDIFICSYIRQPNSRFGQLDFNYADLHTALRFSYERKVSEYSDWSINDSFGFHGKHNNPYRVLINTPQHELSKMDHNFLVKKLINGRP